MGVGNEVQIPCSIKVCSRMLRVASTQQHQHLLAMRTSSTRWFPYLDTLVARQTYNATQM
jgi:hypothetical protein